MANLDKEGIEFLNRLYKDLYKSETVMHGIDERFIGNKADNIGHYIDRMQELHERVATSGRENDLRMLKEFYYRKYVIKEEDIPDAYYDHQKEIYLQRGYGHVEFNDKDKHEMALQIISDQKKSLDVWIDYFVNSDLSYIPMWAKYWAFQGMLSLGSYDKKNKNFSKRSKGTTSPFVDLNREALALSIDFLLKVLNKEELDDKQLEVLVQGGSFGKIYSYILTNTFNKNNNVNKTNEGKWIKYNKGSDCMPLVKSLQGYNTGWCTAGEATAKSQLSMGDFYVYYTYNKKGEVVVPRIAIRMAGNTIAEVRGVAENQNIESEMEEIVEQKLNEFPDKDRYNKKVSDMKRLTEIYKKFKNNEKLKKDDLVFLYEIEQKIEGFGYYKDPRIKEVIDKRNTICDLNDIFKNVVEIDCELNLRILKSAEGLVLPQILNGSLELELLESAEGLVLPQILNGDLDLDSLKSTKGLVLPKEINGDLYLNSLESAEGLVLPQILNGGLNLELLESAEGLVLPQTLEGNLYLSSLESAEGLLLPQIVNGSLDLGSLKSTKGLVLPQTIKNGLDLGSLKSAKGLVLPKKINGDLYLSSLESAEGLVLPQTLDGNLYLSSLESVEGLVLPQILNGDLNLSSIKSTKGLVLPKKINGNLYLSSLESAEGLVLPQILNGDLDLSSLKSTKGLVLPQIVNGSLNLELLERAEGITLPEKFDIIFLADNVVTPKNVHKYVNESRRK